MLRINTTLMVGQRYGRLIVTSIGKPTKWGQARLFCKCDCGQSATVMPAHLKSGHTQSCGCLWRERSLAANTTHGRCGTRAYKAWQSMVDRCRRQDRRDFKNYGGRGISVCRRWATFKNFYADMGDPPPGMSLERTNNSGNYEPGNCRWATAREQGRNKRNNTQHTVNGRVVTVAEMAEVSGVKYSTVYMRLSRGDSPEQAIRPYPASDF